MRRVALTLALVAAVTAWASPGAGAAKPCWQKLVDDWADGAISNLYPIHCYRQALQNMPEDVRLYSSASDDINRALAGLSVSRGLAGRSGSSVAPPPAPAAAAPAADGGSSAPLALAASLGAFLALGAGAGYLAARKRRGAPRLGEPAA